MDALRNWTLESVADVLHCQAPVEDVRFSGVSIDTRSIEKGDLFIAITGENFDGNDYVDIAKQNGAVAAIVSKELDVALPHLNVNDTRIALGELACAHRLNFKKPLIGLTGSNGKTTVKELLGAILKRCGVVLATKGNFNNDIGLPLTLLSLNMKEDFAVIEMGANHPGEIAYLSNIARPDIAILNNAGAAHLEGFGSLEGVARAKGEIFEALDENGIAIINCDDDFADYWLSITSHCKRVGFGISSSDAEVRASKLESGESGVAFDLSYGGKSVRINLPLYGEHNVRNALAASAAAIALQVPLQTIQEAFEGFEPVGGRLKSMRALHNCLIFDDTYNANPSSMKAGIDVVVAMPGDAILVMGDMLEGGKTSDADHRDIGIYAKEAGIKRLFAYGAYSANAVGIFGEGGQHFSEHAQLIEELKKTVNENSVVLIKGSRGMRMERVVEALIEQERGA